MERKSGFAAACGDMTNSTCLLQIQGIKTSKGSTNVLWDNAASICPITYSKAKEEKLHSKQVKLSITKVGGIDEKLTSQLYLVPLVNQYGKTVFIEAYGIERITSDIQAVSLGALVPKKSQDRLDQSQGRIQGGVVGAAAPPLWKYLLLNICTYFKIN